MTSILLLTACQSKQPLSESRTSSPESASTELSISQDSKAEKSTDAKEILVDVTGSRETSADDHLRKELPPTARVPVIPVSETVYEEYSKPTDFLHFYYTFTYLEKLQPEYAGNAIIGDDIQLSCGLHVGMTVVEAETIIPGLYDVGVKSPFKLTTTLNCTLTTG